MPRRHCVLWSKALGHGQKAAKDRRAPGVRLSSSPTALLLIINGKAGGRTFRHAPVVTRAREVGLAVSWNDPAVLRARPFWSRSGKPPDWVGALPVAWENVFSDLKDVISSLLSHLGCGRHSPVLWAGGWGPREIQRSP